MTEELDLAGMAGRIKTARKQRHMTLDAVAGATGFSKSHICDMEKGRSRNPSIRLVWALARALGISPAWLLGADPKVSPIDLLALEVAALIERRLAAMKGVE